MPNQHLNSSIEAFKKSREPTFWLWKWYKTTLSEAKIWIENLIQSMGVLYLSTLQAETPKQPLSNSKTTSKLPEKLFFVLEIRLTNCKTFA